MALNFLLKRSGTASKRPTAASMSLGELDLNYDADTGGVYYKDSNGAVVKVGPCQVSATAPNATPAGSSGNSAGEFWYDTANSALKVWNGTSWVVATSTSAFLPLAGGTMTGNITFSDAGEGVVFSDSSKVDGITDSTSTTDSTLAASATAVKSAYDLANGGVSKSVLTTTGDMLYASAPNTPARLPIGNNGEYLVTKAGVPFWQAFPLTGSTGSSNTRYGVSAGGSLGTNNTTVGVSAGAALTSGQANTAVGQNSLAACTTASNNTAIGRNALAAATGLGNTAVGVLAGATVTAGTQNVYVGLQAGQGNTASQNTFIGTQSGTSLSGSASTGHVCVGYRTGTSLTTGSNNTFLGFTAGDAVDTGSNNTIIGDISGTGSLSNNLILAAGSTIKLQVNENGAVGVGSTPAYGTSGQVLMSNGTGSAPTWTSSAGLLPNYGEFYSTQIQTNLDTTNGNAVTLNTTDASRNFSIVSNSRITAAVAGTYNLMTSIQFFKDDAGLDDVRFWIKINGNNVANSATNITMQGNNVYSLGTVNWIISLNAGDYVEIWWYSLDTQMQLLSEVASAPYPAIPSVIATIVPVGA